ncbi:MAG: hypothetical protein RL199_279 [Pseudomonadota bacterium]|jgi:hypothetical protein
MSGRPPRETAAAVSFSVTECVVHICHRTIGARLTTLSLPPKPATPQISEPSPWDLVLLPATLLGLWFLVQRTLRNELNQDEFQHVHIAWNTLRGTLPYRDFFEHHGPVSAWVGALLLRLRGDAAASFETFFVFRWWNLALIAGQIALTGWLGARVGGDRRSGWLAAGLLTTSGTLGWVGVQYRPDSLQNLLFLASLALLLSRREWWAGICLGLMLGLNAKAMLAVGALGAGFAACLFIEQRGPMPPSGTTGPWPRVARLAGGLALVLGSIAACLSFVGALEAAWQHVLVGNVALAQARASALDIAGQSRSRLWENDAVLVVGLGAALLLAVVEAAREWRRRSAFVFVTVTACLLLGVLFTPMRLYAHLMALPTVAVVAGGLVGGGGHLRNLGAALLGVVLVVSTWQAWKRVPPAVHPATAMQRATVERVLSALPREAAVPYLWPSRCGAYVFNDDPVYDWMLTGNNMFDAAVPGAQDAFLLVFRDRVMHGEFQLIVGEPALTSGIPDDIRAYLQSQFRPGPCLWERR